MEKYKKRKLHFNFCTISFDSFPFQSLETQYDPNMNYNNRWQSRVNVRFLSAKQILKSMLDYTFMLVLTVLRDIFKSKMVFILLTSNEISKNIYIEFHANSNIIFTKTVSNHSASDLIYRSQIHQL